MKKLFLFFSLLLGVLSAWAYDVEADGIFYDLDKENKTASVTYSRDCVYEGAVVIPETISVDGTAYSVTSLGDRCFYFCEGLTEVHANRETPPATGAGTFSECVSLETIYVPTGASANYGIDPWNAYKIVEEEVQSGIAAVTVEGETAVPVYHLNGSRAGTMKSFSTLPKGIYIVKGKKVLR